MNTDVDFPRQEASYRAWGHRSVYCTFEKAHAEKQHDIQKYSIFLCCEN